MELTDKSISVVIPSYNRGATIGRCLEAALSSQYANFEVVVVDDGSTDGSVEIIRQFPCKLVRLKKHSGASKARNIGVMHSDGDILLFIDSDCLLQEDTLSMVNKAMAKYDSFHTVIGGTYTSVPADGTFFCTFQSVFINYFETKKRRPDYLASHAMAIDARRFRESGGFQEKFLPILEDVEFSHRLRRRGFKLVMNPEILVQHIFNFSLAKSLRNAVRKSMYWTIYSMNNGDLFSDSGTASSELKINGITFLVNACIAFISLVLKEPGYLLLTILVFALNLLLNRGLLAAFYKTKGPYFAIMAMLYYTTLYPLAIWMGTLAGIAKYFGTRRLQGKYS